eukprot:2266837-Pleurochrysis_carterae.AAC.1
MRVAGSLAPYSIASWREIERSSRTRPSGASPRTPCTGMSEYSYLAWRTMLPAASTSVARRSVTCSLSEGEDVIVTLGREADVEDVEDDDADDDGEASGSLSSIVACCMSACMTGVGIGVATGTLARSRAASTSLSESATSIRIP